MRTSVGLSTQEACFHRALSHALSACHGSESQTPRRKQELGPCCLCRRLGCSSCVLPLPGGGAVSPPQTQGATSKHSRLGPARLPVLCPSCPLLLAMPSPCPFLALQQELRPSLKPPHHCCAGASARVLMPAGGPAWSFPAGTSGLCCHCLCSVLQLHWTFSPWSPPSSCSLQPLSSARPAPLRISPHSTSSGNLP